MKFSKQFSLAILFLLASCGPPQPIYQTNVELVAPPTQTGRYCANNCLSTKQMCEQSCAIQTQNCRQMNALQEQNDRLQAQNEYEDYVRERTARGAEIKRSLSSFRNYNTMSCEAYSCQSQCESSFHICYSNCGGKVIPHTVCVANCNMPMAQ